MVAPNVHCVVVEVTSNPSRLAESNHRSQSARELVPWADPYIARLVQKVKTEILAERSTGLQNRTTLELPPPDSGMDHQFQDTNYDHWTSTTERF